MVRFIKVQRDKIRSFIGWQIHPGQNGINPLQKWNFTTSRNKNTVFLRSALVGEPEKNLELYSIACTYHVSNLNINAEPVIEINLFLITV